MTVFARYLSSSDNFAPAAGRTNNKSAENPANVIIMPANVHKRVAPLTSMFSSTYVKLSGASKATKRQLRMIVVGSAIGSTINPMPFDEAVRSNAVPPPDFSFQVTAKRGLL
jgi:hypothetical protein